MGAKLQVLAVLLTVALPRRVLPLKTRRVSPAARAAEMVPLMAGVVSLVRPPAATTPVMMPTLSLTAVIAAVVAGTVVSNAQSSLPILESMVEKRVLPATERSRR